MRCGGHVAKNASEAVEQWRRAADNVMFCQEHTVADAITVVKDGTVCETCCFRLGCGATCELDIDDWKGLATQINNAICKILLSPGSRSAFKIRPPLSPSSSTLL